MDHVASLWRYPVKSAAGQSVASCEIDTSGAAGDRRWAVFEADGVIVSAKHPRRGARLLQVEATYDDASATVHVRTPESSVPAAAGSREADAMLSDWLDRPVSLRSLVPEDAHLRRMWPEEEELAAEWQRDAVPGGDAVTPVAGTARYGTFVDYGAVHIVTTGQLRRLAAEHGHGDDRADALRFRPNVVLDTGEHLAPGCTVQLGEVVLRVEIPTPRCVIPGLAHPGVPEDRSLLRTLGAHHRVQVADLGRAPCFGVYAVVEQPGRVDQGTPVRMTAAPPSDPPP